MLWMKLFYVSKETSLRVLIEMVQVSLAYRFRTGAKARVNILELNSLSFITNLGILLLDGSFNF